MRSSKLRWAAFIERRFEAPIGEVEEQLAAIWTEVLERERIGRHDDFFDLGGHSLLAGRLVNRLRAHFGVDVPLRTIFASGTVCLMLALASATAFSVRPFTMTRAPSRASPVAMANPIPLVEAETRAVLSVTFRFID